jgi:hypothetical protein
MNSKSKHRALLKLNVIELKFYNCLTFKNLLKALRFGMRQNLIPKYEIKEEMKDSRLDIG